MSFDSFGSSPLGERKESPLGVFGKGLIGHFLHMGYAGVDIEVSTPTIPIGTNILMAGHVKDLTAPFYMRVVFLSVAIGNVLSITKQSPTGATVTFTTTSTDTVAAAAGLAAACTASADSFFMRMTWTSLGSSVYGRGNDSGSLNFFSFGGGIKEQFIALVGDLVLAFFTLPLDLSAVLSTKRLPWASKSVAPFTQNNYYTDGATLAVSSSVLGIIDYDGISVKRRRTGANSIGFIEKGVNYVYLRNNGIREVVKSTGVSVGSASYSVISGFLSFAYDGTYYYLAASMSTGSRVALLKIDSAFNIVQCYQYQPDVGVLYTHGANVAVENDTVIMYITSTAHDPIWLGVQASDISVVTWAKSSRKHEDYATITVNDTATTYTVNFGVQSVSVTGNATSSDATASDLRDACDAEAVNSSFVARTWTVDGSTVKGVYNFSGSFGAADIAGSVVGGVGAIAVSSLSFLPKFFPAKAPVTDGTYIYYGGKRKINATDFAFAGRKIDASTGAEVWTMTCDETLTGNNELSSVHLSGSDVLFSGRYADTPTPVLRFGTNDLVAMRLPTYTDNLDDQQDTIGISVLEITTIVRSTPAAFDDTFDTNVIIDDAPTISVDDLKLTF